MIPLAIKGPFAVIGKSRLTLRDVEQIDLGPPDPLAPFNNIQDDSLLQTTGDNTLSRTLVAGFSNAHLNGVVFDRGLTLDRFGRAYVSGGYGLNDLSCVQGSETICSGGAGALGPTSSSCAGCPVPVWGDGILSALEECDDGNITSGDGCSDVCLFD